MVKQVELTCSGCGIVFKRNYSSTKYSDHHYCNRECYLAVVSKNKELPDFKPITKDIYWYKCSAILKWAKYNYGFNTHFVSQMKRQIDVSKKELTDKQQFAIDNIIEKCKIDLEIFWDSRWPVKPTKQPYLKGFLNAMKRMFDEHGKRFDKAKAKN